MEEFAQSAGVERGLETMAGELILVVEDKETNRKLVRDVLGFRGYEVLEATTAEDGLAMARARKPDLILMDIQLPVMDGVTALRHLRADPATCNIPVVALTASAMPDEREKILSAGFDGYETKPIGVKRLEEVVREGLAVRRGTS
jgi:two-component system cell cycle response regulator DivK